MIFKKSREEHFKLVFQALRKEDLCINLKCEFFKEELFY